MLNYQERSALTAAVNVAQALGSEVHSTGSLDHLVGEIAELATGRSVVVLSRERHIRFVADQLAGLGFSVHPNRAVSTRGLIFKDRCEVFFISGSEVDRKLHGTNYAHTFIGWF